MRRSSSPPRRPEAEPLSPESRPDARLLTLGRVVGVYGVRGASRIESFCEPRENLFKFKQLWLLRGGERVRVTLSRSGRSAHGLVAHIDDCSTPEAAQQWVGAELQVERELLPPLPAGRYYWCDLEGCTVYNRHGARLGVVQHLFSNGANDVMVLSEGDQERLLPFVPGHYDTEVDLSARCIVMDWDLD